MTTPLSPQAQTAWDQVREAPLRKLRSQINALQGSLAARVASADKIRVALGVSTQLVLDAQAIETTLKAIPLPALKGGKRYRSRRVQKSKKRKTRKHTY